MLSRSLISRANRAFRNPALILSARNSGTVTVARAVDNKPIATIVYLTSNWDGHETFEVFYPAGNQVSHETFASAIHAIEESRSFPKHHRNARRNFSRAVLKAEMDF